MLLLMVDGKLSVFNGSHCNFFGIHLLIRVVCLSRIVALNCFREFRVLSISCGITWAVLCCLLTHSTDVAVRVPCHSYLSCSKLHTGIYVGHLNYGKDCSGILKYFSIDYHPGCPQEEITMRVFLSAMFLQTSLESGDIDGAPVITWVL